MVTFSQGDSFRGPYITIRTGKIRANKVVFAFKAGSHITAMYCKMPALGSIQYELCEHIDDKRRV